VRLDLTKHNRNIEAPLLYTLDERLPYEAVTDASDLGLGVVFLQEDHRVAF
jgi:hypothetical protein